MYKRKGQTQQWFYLRGQVQQIWTRSRKASPTAHKIGLDYVGPEDYYPEDYYFEDYYFNDIEELIALSIGRKSYWQAELILEEAASRLRDRPWDSEFIWCLDKLVELYMQSVDRAKSMLNEALGSEKDVEEVASLLILDRAARIDLDALSNRLIDKHLISLERPNLAATLYFAVAHGACNLARLTLDKASLFGTSFLRALVSGIKSQDRVFRFVRPLHRAVGFGYNEMVRLLVTRGADLEAESEDWDGMEKAPLHVAVEKGRLSTVMYLLSLNANIESRCITDETPLMKAASSGDPDMVRCLLERGARVNQVDRMGRTALHHAAKGGQSANIKLIMAFQADVMARDYYGQTALHLAVCDVHLETIEGLNILLMNTVDVDEKDSG